jgi:hypothetical protein
MPEGSGKQHPNTKGSGHKKDLSLSLDHSKSPSSKRAPQQRLPKWMIED